MTVPEKSTKKRVRRLETELRALRDEVRQLREASPAYGNPKEEWLGRVIGTPAAGDNCFTVELLSCRFTPTAGAQELKIRQRDSRVVAMAYPARPYQAGDYVRVERHRGQLARDAEAGEWWICAGPVELRWGRTVSAAGSYPDLSVAGQATRGVPVYEVELGTMPFTWPTGIGIGWSRLTAGGEVNAASTPFVADSPRVVVQAASLLGDLHKGQPVLMAMESGRLYIVGPVWAMGSRERMAFATTGYSTSSSAIAVDGVINGETMSLRLDSMRGTGGLGSLPSNTSFYDIEPNPSQSTYGDHFATVRRRGDYLCSLVWNPRPWRYGYMSSTSLDSAERQNLLGATIETTTVSSHSHFVSVKNQEPMFWQVQASLVSDAGARFSDIATLTYDQIYGPWQNAMGIASFNAGEQLRLTLSFPVDANVPAAATRRGVQLGYQPTLLMWRLPEGLYLVP